MLDKFSSGIVFINQKGVIELMNDKCEKLLGFKNKVLMKKELETLILRYFFINFFSLEGKKLVRARIHNLKV